ncbi:YeiH family protein [Streptomyces sp. PR69]|uniref:YeiH family protein n=1 Tax=Streptomyces sp. PR69 TaxID=2984950 RepID=UPI0022653E07|nr:putative sulfate exporter family transporter [Streptomyces sp. PR69]
MALPRQRTATLTTRPPRPRLAPGLALAAFGVLLAWCVHLLLPDVPLLTASVALGIVAAQLPGVRTAVRATARPGLSYAGRRLMRIGIVLLGLRLGLDAVLGAGWATLAVVLGVVAATFFGTWRLGRRLGLPGDQPLLIAAGYAICGASAIGAVSEARRSDERDAAASVALVTLCGTLAIVVLPLLQQPLQLSDAEFGRWAGASVHDVGQVVAAAQAAGPGALDEAVLVKLMRVALLAPLAAAVALSVRGRVRHARTAAADGRARPAHARPPWPWTAHRARGTGGWLPACGSGGWRSARGIGRTAPGADDRSGGWRSACGSGGWRSARGVGRAAPGADDRSDGSGREAGRAAEGSAGGARPPVVPLFVVGFLAMAALSSTGLLPPAALDAAGRARELLLAAALFGLGSAVDLPSLARTGRRAAALGLAAWALVACVSYAGVALLSR